MKKKIAWPTWEQLELEKQQRWNSLPLKFKLGYLDDWYDFLLKVMFSEFNEKRNKLKLSLKNHGKN